MQQPQSPSVVTLRQVWGDFRGDRDIKPATVRNYSQRLNKHLGDWLDIAVTSITKDMIESRHREIAGPAQANSVMRMLRSLLTYAAFKYESADGAPIIVANPVRRLSEIRAWHSDGERRTLVQPHQMAAWFRAVYSLENASIRDAMLLMIFTGMRKGEALNLKWSDVDLKAGTINLKNTKNGEDFTVPLSDCALSILCVRSAGGFSDYVFPGQKTHSPLRGLDSSCKLVAERSGVEFCLHDLRRSFCSLGDELDLKAEVIKNLVNHTPEGVTEGYIIRSTERLRRATQAITDCILTHARLAKRHVVVLTATED